MPRPSKMKHPPASRERLLVCLSSSPFAIPLIRATKRIADAQGSKWFALYVETPAHDRLSPEGRGEARPNHNLLQREPGKEMENT